MFCDVLRKVIQDLGIVPPTQRARWEQLLQSVDVPLGQDAKFGITELHAMIFTHVVNVMFTRRERTKLTMGRALPRLSVAMRMGKPVLTLTIELVWLHTVFEETDMRVEIFHEMITKN